MYGFIVLKIGIRIRWVAIIIGAITSISVNRDFIVAVLMILLLLLLSSVLLLLLLL